MMPNQQATLAFILANGRFEPEITGIGSRYRCPFCPKPTRDPLASLGHTLRVFPTANGDLVFRCHRCAFVLDSVEFVQKLTPYPDAEQPPNCCMTAKSSRSRPRLLNLRATSDWQRCDRSSTRDADDLPVDSRVTSNPFSLAIGH